MLKILISNLTNNTMPAKSIRQTVTIKAKPHDIYEALMDSKKHAKFSGAPAKISRAVGGKFTAYGDYIEGVNLELKKDRKIVQQWRGSDWKKGIYSKVSYTLIPVKRGTKLVFYQSGVPGEYHLESINKGWIDYYWTPIKKMLEK
jgi:activator of HSP90 ATPase